MSLEKTVEDISDQTQLPGSEYISKDGQEKSKRITLLTDDCWMMKLGRDLLGFTDTEWIEVPLAYDHGEPRCWHTTAVIPDGEVYIHSGLTQPFYITMALLIVNIFSFDFYSCQCQCGCVFQEIDICLIANYLCK